MNKKGFTFVEILVALPIFLLVVSMILVTYIVMQKFFTGGVVQAAYQSLARSSLERVAKNVRLATATTVNSAGDTLTLTLDPNRTYSEATDDVTAQYTVSGNMITYDPNTSVSGDSVTLVENVQQQTGIPYFQKDSDLVVITFKVYKNISLLGVQTCSVSTTVKMRNNYE